ncbi:hypothetical protein SAMN05421578_10583 [Paenibacillus macquariensis]|uniref:Transposase n=1 Tax=Paenibacillus macquariensis TaxID=948756 RepID=A0ABY1JX64_9BACL|nr:hypothetical protein SAMN05421578_10583 [Paenibacillus macquariensis]
MIIKARTWLSLTSGEQMSALKYLADRTSRKWSRREGQA